MSRTRVVTIALGMLAGAILRSRRTRPRSGTSEPGVGRRPGWDLLIPG